MRLIAVLDHETDPRDFEDPLGQVFVGYLDGSPVATGAWRRSSVTALGADELQRAPHALYGHVHPSVAYSTGAWLRDSFSMVERISRMAAELPSRMSRLRRSRW